MLIVGSSAPFYSGELIDLGQTPATLYRRLMRNAAGLRVTPSWKAGPLLGIDVDNALVLSSRTDI